MTTANHDPEDHSPDVGEVDISDLTARDWPVAASERMLGFQVVMRQSVLNDIHAHAASSPDAEICGVLVGDVVRDDSGPFVHVEANIRGEFAASQTAGVTFTAETWTYMQGILETRFTGKRILGWYHSHPDFGVFLSEMDVFIHRHFFNLPWQIAHVVDPIRGDEGLFVWQGGTPERDGFCVEKDAHAVECKAPARSRGRSYGANDHCQPVGPDVLALRSRIKWLTAGVLAALLVSLVWPVVLVIVSQRSEWIRDILRIPPRSGQHLQPSAGSQRPEQPSRRENHEPMDRPAAPQGKVGDIEASSDVPAGVPVNAPQVQGDKPHD